MTVTDVTIDYARAAHDCRHAAHFSRPHPRRDRDIPFVFVSTWQPKFARTPSAVRKEPDFTWRHRRINSPLVITHASAMADFAKLRLLPSTFSDISHLSRRWRATENSLLISSPRSIHRVSLYSRHVEFFFSGVFLYKSPNYGVKVAGDTL